MPAMPQWIDTHCHLDASEFDADRDAVRAAATAAGVLRCVLPAVQPQAFDAVRRLAHRHGDAYALGLHPLYVPDSDAAAQAALDALARAIAQHAHDPRLVAVGEIGLDGFGPTAAQAAAQQRQRQVYRAQLGLARRYGLPVILHVRQAVDQVLRGLRDLPVTGGIAHAFNGSRQQADQLLGLGFKLGFGGALTYERATRLRALATALPPSALVLETDAPDIPPHWLYVTAAQRAAGVPQGRNRPAELPRIGQLLAGLRRQPVAELAAMTRANAEQALPRLGRLAA